MKIKPFFFCNYSFISPKLGVMMRGYHQESNVWNDAQDVRGIQIHVGLLLAEVLIHVGIEKCPLDCKFSETQWPP
jgi:hypothetical protein